MFISHIVSFSVERTSVFACHWRCKDNLFGVSVQSVSKSKRNRRAVLPVHHAQYARAEMAKR